MSVKLQPNDSEDIVEVKVEIANHMLFVKDTVELTGIEDEIKLIKVNKLTLEKIIKYCESLHEHNQKSIEKPLKANELDG